MCHMFVLHLPVNGLFLSGSVVYTSSEWLWSTLVLSGSVVYTSSEWLLSTLVLSASVVYISSEWLCCLR